MYVPTTLEALTRGWRIERFPSRVPPPETDGPDELSYPSTPYTSQPRSTHPDELAYANSDDATSSPIKRTFDETRLAAVAAKAAREKDKDWDWQADLDDPATAENAVVDVEVEDMAQPWDDDGGFVEDTEIRMSQSQSARARGKWKGKERDPRERESSLGYET